MLVQYRNLDTFIYFDFIQVDIYMDISRYILSRYLILKIKNSNLWYLDKI